MTAEREYAFVVDEERKGERLDVYLAGQFPEQSRSQVQRLIDAGAVSVNGDLPKPSLKLQVGDLISATILPPSPSSVAAQEIPLDVLYEDQNLLVVNKPKGMVVHPAPGSEEGTLVNALLAHCTELSGIGGELRPGIVHRLDKDTTGLMVVAKNDFAHHDLQAQIQKRTCKRRYLALIWGRPPWDEATVDAPIARHPKDPRRMSVAESGSRAEARYAITDLKVRERLNLFTLLECNLQTGRTHQIRVHCQYAGYPVVGDPLYDGMRLVRGDILGTARAAELNARIGRLHGQVLHAFALSFDHPTTGERMEFEVPPPPEMTELLDYLRAVSQEVGW
jgi:23S rRNA pseudouridine1911/1915/1917 synthase